MTPPSASSQSPGSQPATAEPGDPNEVVRYTVWAIYARAGDAPLDGAGEAVAAAGLDAWAADLASSDVVLRGLYDISGLRAEGDLMAWLHGPSAESLQAALRGFRRTEAGGSATLSFSLMGTHRPAEFSRDHVPSFMRGTAPLEWLCVYPFVRSYEWYLLPEEERREMLREHGLAGRKFPRVQANTVASFALNDFEWILALEADDLHDLVDMMRDLRYTQARRHVREEIPFFTGRLVDAAGALEVLR
ncbi:MAG TPA: hydrogen peroxide-dependent heme synthase [Candidatus Limnocylindrales bacterium]|nr:hydrogen peroxide-dependent heme synthase [Candidatus Limnocylindrales bacterium]